jgi:hypothetical protein
MKIAVTHFYKLGNDAWSDIIDTDRLPDDLRLQFEQAALVQLTKLSFPESVMQGPIYDAGGVNQFPLMLDGRITLTGTEG